MARQYVEIEDVEVLKATDKALLVYVDSTEIWLPRSQIHASSAVDAQGDKGQIVVTKWIAEQKEIEFDESALKDEDDL